MKNLKIYLSIISLVFLTHAGITIKNDKENIEVSIESDGTVISTEKLIPTEGSDVQGGDPFKTLYFIRENDDRPLRMALSKKGFEHFCYNNIYAPEGRFLDPVDLRFKYKDESPKVWYNVRWHGLIYEKAIEPDLNLLLPNYIRTKSYRYRDKGGKSESIQYADGYGRVVQTQGLLNNYKSFITGTYFNENNKEYKAALPFSSIKFGQYLDMRDEKLIDSANDYYSKKFGNDEQFAYVEKEYHNDPRGDVHAVSLPGAGFDIESGHTVQNWQFSIVGENNYFTNTQLTSGTFENDWKVANTPTYDTTYTTIYDTTFIEHVAKVKVDSTIQWIDHSGSVGAPADTTWAYIYEDVITVETVITSDTDVEITGTPIFATHLLNVSRDRDGNFVQHVKNSKNELVLAWSYDGTKEIISKYEYDDRGNLLHEIMPIEVAGKGRCRNSYGYDTQDRLIWKVSPDKDTVRFYYDKFSRLDSTVARNNTLIPEYDELGRLVKSYVRINGGDKVLLARTYYDSKTTLDNEIFDVFEKPEDLAVFKKIVGLDGKGEIKYSRGRSIATVTYNSKDEVVHGEAGFTYKGSPLVGLTSQDEEGRTNASYSYYGAVGWQKAVNTFDLQGNVLTTDTYHHYDPSKENTPVISIENVYDDLGRVVAVRDNKTKENFVSFVFTETGEVKEKLLYGKDNKVIDKVVYTNNIRGQLQELESDKYKQSMGYVGSYNGNITSTTHDYKNGTAVTQNFAYDGVNRLQHSTTPVGDSIHKARLTESFTYDENGRFDTRTKNGKTWTYNYFDGRYGDNVLGHQLKSVTGYHSDDVNNENYEYDENGNMIWDASKKMHVTYNYQNMPVKFTFYEDTRDLNPETRLGNPISEVEMVYNGAGTRLQKIERIFDGETVTVNGKLYSGGFVYTATNTITKGEDDNLTFELDYVNTPGGRIDYENGVEQERFVYLQDHLGSTRMTLNEAGVVVESDLFTAMGEEVDMVTANETTEKFTGKELDKDGAVEDSNGDVVTAGMGLNFFGWRYYDPVVGMWISTDPAEQHFNPYLYGSLNPIMMIDPDGLEDKVYFIVDGSSRLFIPASVPNIATIKNKGYSVETNIESFNPPLNNFDRAGALALQSIKDKDAVAIVIMGAHGASSAGDMTIGFTDLRASMVDQKNLPKLKLVVFMSCDQGNKFAYADWTDAFPSSVYYWGPKGFIPNFGTYKDPKTGDSQIGIVEMLGGSYSGRGDVKNAKGTSPLMTLFEKYVFEPAWWSLEKLEKRYGK